MFRFRLERQRFTGRKGRIRRDVAMILVAVVFCRRWFMELRLWRTDLPSIFGDIFGSGELGSSMEDHGLGSLGRIALQGAFTRLSF